jgi:CBS domain containing-hemolysin-like protein
MSEYLPGLAWLVVLLAGNAFFVGSEFAVISARRSQIEPRAAEGGRAARSTLWAMEHATLMLATSQLGITVCSLLILTVSEPAIHHLLEYPLAYTPMSESAISITAFVVALVLVTYLHVVLGEMVPKNLAFSVPDRAALILAPALVFVSRLTRPVIAFLNGAANSALRMVGVEPKDEAASTFTLQEVAGIVEQSRREGTLADDGGTLERAFEFTDRTVGEVEVPLADMVLLPEGCTPADVQRAVVEHGHSRFVLADDAGQPVGYLHMKDVMDFRDDQYAQPIPQKRVRRLVGVPREAEVEDALTTFRRHGTHLARTIGEGGRTVGILFLEDVLEVLVGEVDDTLT